MSQIGVDAFRVFHPTIPLNHYPSTPPFHSPSVALWIDTQRLNDFGQSQDRAMSQIDVDAFRVFQQFSDNDFRHVVGRLAGEVVQSMG